MRAPKSLNFPGDIAALAAGKAANFLRCATPRANYFNPDVRGATHGRIDPIQITRPIKSAMKIAAPASLTLRAFIVVCFPSI